MLLAVNGTLAKAPFMLELAWTDYTGYMYTVASTRVLSPLESKIKYEEEITLMSRLNTI